MALNATRAYWFSKMLSYLKNSAIDIAFRRPLLSLSEQKNDTNFRPSLKSGKRLLKFLNKIQYIKMALKGRGIYIYIYRHYIYIYIYIYYVSLCQAAVPPGPGSPHVCRRPYITIGKVRYLFINVPRYIT